MALIKAINSVDANRLRSITTQHCAVNPDLVRELESQWLVHGRDVIRYHADTDSEDDENSDKETSDEELYDSDEYNEEEKEDDRKARRNAMRGIKVGNDDATPRYAKCLHCRDTFDVTTNGRGDCCWHPGMLFRPRVSWYFQLKYSQE